MTIDGQPRSDAAVPAAVTPDVISSADVRRQMQLTFAALARLEAAVDQFIERRAVAVPISQAGVCDTTLPVTTSPPAPLVEGSNR